MTHFSILRPYLGLIIAASAAFSMSTLFSSVKPVLLTQFMAELDLQAGIAGWIVAAPFVGISLASLLVGRLLTLHSYKIIVSYSGAVLVISQALNSLLFTNTITTLLLQLLSGIGVGILMGATSSFIARSKTPGTLFGLVDMIGVLLMSAMVAGVSITTEKHGLSGGFAFSAVLCILYWFSMYFYKHDPISTGHSQRSENKALSSLSFSLRPLVIIVMGILFVTFSGQGFAFMFTIASNLGMTYEQSGSYIGIILFLSAFACLVGGMCSARFGPEKPLLGAFVVCAAGWTIAINSQSQMIFLIGLFPAICALQFCFPVLLSLAGKLDEHGRWAAIATPLFTSGFAWAAILAGQVVEVWGVNALASTTQIGMLICIGLLGVSVFTSIPQKRTV